MLEDKLAEQRPISVNPNLVLSIMSADISFLDRLFQANRLLNKLNRKMGDSRTIVLVCCSIFLVTLSHSSIGGTKYGWKAKIFFEPLHLGFIGTWETWVFRKLEHIFLGLISRNLFHSFIQSYVSYCPTVSMSTFSSFLKPLSRYFLA